MIDKMARDITLALHALTYVIRLHADLTSEHGAPTLGTQNQAVDFILADPELSRAVATWAAVPNIGEASTKPYQRLPHNELYRRILPVPRQLGIGFELSVALGEAASWGCSASWSECLLRP
jgi:hypothetical protein